KRQGEVNEYSYQPRGVGLVISPWNFPLAILTGMVSASIAAGNCVILKPSMLSTLVAEKFISCLKKAGIPDSVVNLIPGEGHTAGEYMVSHPDISFIAFTGSMEVGLRINSIAANTAKGQESVKRVVAEMGGKNAIIIDEDADMDEAVVGTIHSAFGYQGQKCSAASRVIVLEGVYERFISRLVESAKAIKVGYPEDPGTHMGPLISADAKNRVLGYIKEGKENFTLLLETNVDSIEGGGHFAGPAIFADVPHNSRMAQEEIFGPVLAVFKVKDFREAIRLLNDTRFALTGGLYSRSPVNIELAKKELQAGNLYINRKITGAKVGRQPFGGFKMSGVGSKAGGHDYLLQFVLPRTVTENTIRHGFAPI
ncbi:MAG: aldehyde dehydrogenase family protein, partial [Candidatus Omnitrophica bacterium]|nr:aldehyde dehydrogenase family protein [Candidatus Omnitrophota bacterium]